MTGKHNRLPYAAAGNSIFFAVKRIEDPIGLLPAKLILGINKVRAELFRPGLPLTGASWLHADSPVQQCNKRPYCSRHEWRYCYVLQRGVHFFRPVPKEYLHSAELRDIMQVCCHSLLRASARRLRC